MSDPKLMGQYGCLNSRSGCLVFNEKHGTFPQSSIITNHNARVVEAPHALISGASGGDGRLARFLRLLLLLALTYVAGYLFGGILEASPLRTYFYTPIYNATQPSTRVTNKSQITWPKTQSTKTNPETIDWHAKNITVFINKFNDTLNVTEKKMSEVVSQVHNITANATVQSGFRETSTYNGTSMIITKILTRIKRRVTTTDVRYENGLPLSLCPEMPSGLGPVPVNMSDMELEFVEKKFPEVQWGGMYVPPNCISRHKTAIIIPYRNREKNLPVFLNHIHPFLMKQEIEYGIFLVEQEGDNSFNRAKLLNVGFLESQWLQNGWQCFVFHDIDLLPLDTRNMYTCPQWPQHMSVHIEKFDDTLKDKIKLPFYENSFGGVSMVTLEQFTKVNGFSNRYWGWGSEDNDIFLRFLEAGYPIARDDSSIARYTMMHQHHTSAQVNTGRLGILAEATSTFRREGLSTIKYELVKCVQYHLYTHILANIDLADNW